MIKILALFTALSLPALHEANAHCQVPCGIYDDDNVLQSMRTDLITIEKASKMITELSADPSKNAHQLTRWITNKESHAQALQDKVLNYFLSQRLKLGEATSDRSSYEQKLSSSHRLIVYAMQTKQSTDPSAVKNLHDELHTFTKLFGQKK